MDLSPSVSPSPRRGGPVKWVEEARPASPLTLEEADERERLKKEQEERDKEAIARSMDDLEEVDEIQIREDREADSQSLGSLPSVKGEEEVAAIIGDSIEGLEEVHDIHLKEDDDDCAASIGSLPSVGEEEPAGKSRQPSPSVSPPGSPRRTKSKSVRGSTPPWEGPRSSRTPPPGEDQGRHQQMQRRNSREETRQEGGNFRTKRRCLVCKSRDHLAKECPDLVCYKCNEGGHFAKECPNPARPRPRPPPPPVERHYAASAANPDRNAASNVICYNCKETGHHIKACPTLHCKKCGGKGHFAKECGFGGGPSSSYVPPPPPMRRLSQWEDDPGFSGGSSSSTWIPSRPKPLGQPPHRRRRGDVG